MTRTAFIYSAALALPLITAPPSIAGQRVPCVERTDGNGNKTYFKAASFTSGVEGMSSDTITSPKRFFTVDLPGGKNYYKNRYGGMIFFSGECIY